MLLLKLGREIRAGEALERETRNAPPTGALTSRHRRRPVDAKCRSGDGVRRLCRRRRRRRRSSRSFGRRGSRVVRPGVGLLRIGAFADRTAAVCPALRLRAPPHGRVSPIRRRGN